MNKTCKKMVLIRMEKNYSALYYKCSYFGTLWGMLIHFRTKTWSFSILEKHCHLLSECRNEDPQRKEWRFLPVLFLNLQNCWGYSALLNWENNLESNFLTSAQSQDWCSLQKTSKHMWTCRFSYICKLLST